MYLYSAKYSMAGVFWQFSYWITIDQSVLIFYNIFYYNNCEKNDKGMMKEECW